MKEEIELLKQKVNKLSNMAWVLGVVAGIFGLTGSFGLDAILEAKKEIDALQKSVVTIQEEVENSEKLFADYRQKQEAEFDKYVESKKEEIVFKEDFDHQSNELEKKITTLSDELEGKTATLSNTFEKKVTALNNRVSNIRLVAGSTYYNNYRCGEVRKSNDKDLTFMYGYKDGTGCEVISQAHFKTISLSIPK